MIGPASMQGLVLGLSSGTACLAYCAPVLMPYVLGQGTGLRGSVRALAYFLCGRLFGYLLFAVAAFGAGAVLMRLGVQGLVVGAAYIVLGAVLGWYGFRSAPDVCPMQALGGVRARMRRAEAWLPLVLGFLTGLNLCPPFVLAFTAAADVHSLLGSLSFFFMFFVVTSLYVLPIPVLGAVNRSQRVRIVSRLAAGVVAVYYIYLGIIKTVAGIDGFGLA